jgi:hypothetical protein
VLHPYWGGMVTLYCDRSDGNTSVQADGSDNNDENFYLVCRNSFVISMFLCVTCILK